jgi:hypothetical protein
MFDSFFTKIELLVIGYWLLVIGYWLLVISYWLLVIGYWLLVIGYYWRQSLWICIPRQSLGTKQRAWEQRNNMV